MSDNNILTINCYFITNGITCYDIVNLINQKDILSKVGITSISNNKDSFLSDMGVYNIKELSKKHDIKKIIEYSDFIGSSLLKSSIETSLLYSKNNNKSNFFNNKNFDININENKKLFDNKKNNQNKKLFDNKKKNYNNKLNDINWSILNNAIKNKLNINNNPKKFIKSIYTKLIKKIYVNYKKEYNMTFFTNIQFIIELLKLFKKKLDNNDILNITNNGIIQLTFKYNIKSFNNILNDYKIIHPTNLFHPLYYTINDDYYYKFNNDEYPLNYKKINKKLLTKDLIKRCENYKKISKKISDK
jgi:hypothetical protein